ncbi:hypothetical protein GCM10010319_60620 [Streptomyces blastmyceticus]|uniref:Uncharacterized protein n=1 Tax=Streptomyces blastmyceticus TaxID=68180 RepID=A0ABP3HM48_9ACTN
MKSEARARLARMAAPRGASGMLVIRRDLGESADGPDRSTGPLALAPCECDQHRAGAGAPDSAAWPSLGRPQC